MVALTVKNCAAPELMELIPAHSGAQTQFWHCFKSPEAIAEHLKDKEPVAWESTAWCTNRNPWSGTPSMAAALRLCRDGWQEGAERVAKLRDRIVPTIPVERRLATYGVAGCLPNVQRYLAGNPMHMKRPDDIKSKRRPVITLINHMGGTADVKGPTFANRAAAIAAVADAIESAGYSCHIIGVSYSIEPANGSFGVGVAVTIKEAGVTLDIGRMAFALGHTSMFRRFVFGVRSSDNDNRPLGTALGRTADFDGPRPDNVYVLPSMNELESVFETEDLAATRGIAKVIEILRRQDCPAFAEAA